MSVQKLQKAVKKRRSDFPVGTVIRWTSSSRFYYAAICTPVGWTTTARYGNTFVPQSLTFQELLKIIERPETTEVMVSKEWEEIG